MWHVTSSSNEFMRRVCFDGGCVALIRRTDPNTSHGGEGGIDAGGSYVGAPNRTPSIMAIETIMPKNPAKRIAQR
jgi:hypothetical protein